MENLSIDQIRDHFTQMKNGMVIPRTEYTHCLEIFTFLKSGISDLAKFFDTAFRPDALTTRMEFADGKIYELTIREIKLEGVENDK